MLFLTYCLSLCDNKLSNVHHNVIQLPYITLCTMS